MASWTLEKDLAAAQLPEFLRALATALEQRSTDAAGFVGLPAQDLRELHLSVEREGHSQGHGHLSVKLKAKGAGEAQSFGLDAQPSGLGAQSSGHEAQVEPAAPRKASASASAVHKEKYRQLKKGMQADFKILERAARLGAMPTGEELDSFLSRVEIMVEMDAPGAEPELARANAAFLAEAAALRQAVQKRDAAALADVLARLDRRKGACHAQFK